MAQIRLASSIVLHSPLFRPPVLAAADTGSSSGAEADGSGLGLPDAAATSSMIAPPVSRGAAGHPSRVDRAELLIGTAVEVPTVVAYRF